MKIPLKRAWWTQQVDAGSNNMQKSHSAGAGLRLWYLGHAVLIEQDNAPDRLVPSAGVLMVEPVGKWNDGPSGPVMEGLSALAGVEMRARAPDELAVMGELAAKQHAPEPPAISDEQRVLLDTPAPQKKTPGRKKLSQP